MFSGEEKKGFTEKDFKGQQYFKHSMTVVFQIFPKTLT